MYLRKRRYCQYILFEDVVQYIYQKKDWDVDRSDDDCKKQYVYEGGVRFEVTPYGLICSLEETTYKKHDCPDCRFCQWCAEIRCSGCRRDQAKYHRGDKSNGGS